MLNACFYTFSRLFFFFIKQLNTHTYTNAYETKDVRLVYLNRPVLVFIINGIFYFTWLCEWVLLADRCIVNMLVNCSMDEIQERIHLVRYSCCVVHGGVTIGARIVDGIMFPGKLEVLFLSGRHFVWFMNSFTHIFPLLFLLPIWNPTFTKQMDRDWIYKDLFMEMCLKWHLARFDLKHCIHFFYLALITHF